MNFEDTFYGRPNTVTTYRSLYNRHLKNTLNELDPQLFNSWDEQMTLDMCRTWERKGLSRSTRITLIRLLGKYIKFKGGPDVDTQKFIRSLDRSEQQKEVTALSSNEAKILMNVARRLEPKFYPVLLLALHAGLRRGEIFGLRCGDIDILHGNIKVSHSYNGPTKNGRSRIVPMSPELVKVLTSARNLLMRNPSEHVFEQFDPNPVLRRLCDHASIRTIRFHDLRHSFATMALENGVSPRKVQAWLGHSSVVTTMSIYWNLTNEESHDLNFLPE